MEKPRKNAGFLFHGQRGKKRGKSPFVLREGKGGGVKKGKTGLEGESSKGNKKGKRTVVSGVVAKKGPNFL